MPRISVMTPDRAHAVSAAGGCAALAGARAYYDDADSGLHLHLQEIAPGATLNVRAGDVDRLAYVWRGEVTVGACRLGEGSSLIAERGRAVAITGGSLPSQVLLFAAAQPPEASAAGGHVHLLPVESVPRSQPNGELGVAGGMHFDSSCPTCNLWLHENRFPGAPPPSPEELARIVHSHSQDEIIFVTDGAMRLGAKLHGPGTAIAIAADTLYSFSAGPDGLAFVNFRAQMPTDIRFANGTSMSETGYWQGLVPRPKYVEA